MVRLENLVVAFAKKHPIITSIALIKLAQSAIVVGAYCIWPEETSRVLNHAYATGKECRNFLSPILISYQNEIINSLRDFPATLRIIRA